MEIIVQGTGVEYFTPDEVVISIKFSTKGISYNQTLTDGVKNVQTFVDELLLKNGFKKEEMKTRSFVIREETKYDESTRQYVKVGYSFNQEANLNFDYDKEKIANILEDLSKLENAPVCQIKFKVKDEKQCKRSILSKAYKDAELQAMAIAEASGKTLKQCVKIDFKPFTTSYFSASSFPTEMYNMRDSAASVYGAAPSIINTFTPEDIEISETIYCLWLAE